MATDLRKIIFVSALWLPSFGVMAEGASGLTFSHKDWEIACDNTNTCRVAGYQSDEDKLPISVLLTRKAGPGEQVTAKVQVADWIESDHVPDVKLPDRIDMALYINGRRVGSVVVDRETRTADLPQAHVDALLSALLRTSTIEWVAGSVRWRLSDKGAAAVLLKMDDVQGRLNTPGALVRKGTQSEDKVVKPLPLPVVVIPPLPDAAQEDIQLDPGQSEALRASIAAITNEDDCAVRGTEHLGEFPLSVYRLSDTKWLVSVLCWTAVYNSGDGFWVVNAIPPYHPVLVTHSGSYYDAGVIRSSQRGRGMADCHFSEAWSWDGNRFIQTESSHTGMCKGLYGAWHLPTLSMDVRHTR